MSEADADLPRGKLLPSLSGPFKAGKTELSFPTTRLGQRVNLSQRNTVAGESSAMVTRLTLDGGDHIDLTEQLTKWLDDSSCHDAVPPAVELFCGHCEGMSE